ncbi:hypothetical protein B0T26DRAFT_737545 [Lasiosphaeria miniovina]|uniref:Integral membrane protein TmpA n=1 Tax=Lasiosphaeria miniovina TaxID=1954250 RepID=A0AA40EGU5_9PEZI|nr:uncharacterized protein B0T26DRAFT_737545 [Lasiosphaeria miniovina]KAK0735093.1 hypothetical protein B0T26DRAFT_737545 [Lasiosphaeria miniovina]
MYIVHLQQQRTGSSMDQFWSLAPSLALSLAEKQPASSSTTDVEVQKDEVDEHPRKRLGFVRYTALNVYRRLFSLAFIGNAVAFVVLVLKGGTAPMDLVNAAAINIAVCGLCRQPLVVNALFITFGSVPRSAPLRLRCLACKIFHLGGVHSGTGVAACLWYAAFTGVYTTQYRPAPVATAVLVLVWLVLALLLAIAAVAYPAFRVKYHDCFELTHRFANWIILAVFWALLLLMAAEQPSMGPFLVNLPAFWVLIVLTLATIHPWLLLRRVPVVPEALSPHAGMSVATRPLADWHSFATFPDRFDTPGTRFSCLVSKAGDWTRGAINTQPTHLWVRGMPAYGFGYRMRLFSRLVVVTTGSGISPCLAFLGDENRPQVRVVWQTKSPLKTYGQRTLDLVGRLDAEPMIFDTSHTGRVDMLPVVFRLYKEFGAEAVCIISNPKVTSSLAFDLESRGIPAFGPILDS